MFARFRSGETKVLCSIVVLAVGFDEPVASCAILARPTLSRIMHIQQIGRVMRIHPDKRDCVVLDHAGNVIRHDKVEAFDPPDLSMIDKRSDTKRKTDSVTDYRPCPACRALMSPGQSVCHECGHELERKNKVHHVPGELSEDDTERPVIDHVAMQQLYLELRWVAKERGYKDGWAFFKLKEHYGYRAPFAWKSLRPIEPSGKTPRLVQSWDIANRKRRRAA